MFLEAPGSRWSGREFPLESAAAAPLTRRSPSLWNSVLGMPIPEEGDPGVPVPPVCTRSWANLGKGLWNFPPLDRLVPAAFRAGSVRLSPSSSRPKNAVFSPVSQRTAVEHTDQQEESDPEPGTAGSSRNSRSPRRAGPALRDVRSAARTAGPKPIPKHL